MNARTQMTIAALLLVLTLGALVGGFLWSLNAPAVSALATTSLTTAAALSATGLLVPIWLVTLRLLRGLDRATLRYRWLAVALLAVCLPVASLWAALSLGSVPLATWGLVPELLGLLPLLGALATPLLGLLALGALVADAEGAHHPPVGDALPPHLSATRLTAEEIARELAEAHESAALPDGAEPQPDDLTRIRGIGPKTAGALQAGGIDSFGELAATNQAEIVRVLRAAGIRPGDVDAWREEAARLADQRAASSRARRASARDTTA